MKYYNILFKRNFWLLPITIGSIIRTSIRIRKVDWFIYTREHKLGSSDLVTAWLQIRCMYGNETSMHTRSAVEVQVPNILQTLVVS
jgi:hypothetical protein